VTDTVATPSNRPIPEGYRTLTPALTVRNAAAAIDFYKRAFGAQQLARMDAPDGSGVWHAELQIGDSRIMLGDEFPEMADTRSPQTLEGTSVSIQMYVEDVDAAYQRALDAGATSVMPPEDMFWGDRYSKVTDPFGHSWALMTNKETVSEDEMRRRAQAFVNQAS
jgi:PhnB protein